MSDMENIDQPGQAVAGRRSEHWFNAPDRGRLAHRGALWSLGYGPDATDGRPIIGIGHSASDLSPCNVHLARLAQSVANGVWQAGGVPLTFPTMSLGEAFMRPTAMLFRNLMSMEVEELLRANPLDGVVLLSACDKTTPAMLMGLASVGIPGMLITGGPKLNGKFRGVDVGSGTSRWQFEQDVSAGRMTQAEYEEADLCAKRSEGHCMTMGTASTMASIVEALGMQLSGLSSLPAVDKRRYALAHTAGRKMIELVRDDLTPERIMTREAFENAVRVNAAIGGSTNAIVHLLAIARRVGVALSLDDLDEVARDVPLLANVLPSGKFLMEDFCYAGGLPALMHEMGDLLYADAITVSGRSLGEEVAHARVWDREVIGSPAAPFLPAGMGTAVLRGNLAPRGAIIKQSAASPQLMVHRGQALVFESPEEYLSVYNDPDLEVEASTVLVIRNVGPAGYPGMPEVANVPLPAKLVQQGISDIVRISDGRMSGTAFGTVVLHVAPEAAVGGPLSLVRNGDWIELDVPNRRLHLDVPDSILDERRAQSAAPSGPEDPDRGYVWLYRRHVLQADEGADFDFLTGSGGRGVGRE
ncbi:IlvD/Edd family dehydratase [Dactylosporangium sp. NPDC051484]|uniref:IlvD/Edd family dehydratase n=1 Tax=Dactylosporangium sp. NPDC051484 TaxID=3154942 RepID=UPI00344C969A